MEKDVAILDIGSHKLVFVVAHKTSKGIYTIKNFATYFYCGYFKGQWVDSNMLGSDINAVITKSNYKGNLKNVYVGVPSDFVKLENNSFVTNFAKDKIINNDVLTKIRNSCEIFSADNHYSVISSASTGYEIDNNAPVISAIGKRATQIKANMSFLLCKKTFIAQMQSIMSACGFLETKFVCSAWAQSCKLLDEACKASGALVVDVGYANTSIAYQLGEGLNYLASESIGGANIADDLAFALEMQFEEAQIALEKINLNCDLENNQLIKLYKDGNPIFYKQEEINNIIKARLDDFVSLINYHINYLDMPPSQNAIYITGGGLIDIRGAIGYIEKCLNKPIRVLIADAPQFDTPNYSSVIATIDVASEINYNSSIWKKLLG